MQLFLLLWIQLICMCLLASSAGFDQDKLEKNYQKQQERLARETNPIGKAKIFIKMSEITLEEAAHRIRKEDLDEADKLLIRYSNIIDQAHETLKSSQRNAQRNPAGFKEFEISLRKQLRKLADLKLNYPFDQQEKINQAIASAESAKEDMLIALFGPENTRRGKVKSHTRKNDKSSQ